MDEATKKQFEEAIKRLAETEEKDKEYRMFTEDKMLKLKSWVK